MREKISEKKKVSDLILEETIMIKDEYMTLGQALKEAAVIDSGGAAKIFLAEVAVWVNDKEENRRGRKLYPGDQVAIENIGTVSIVRNET